MVELDQEVFELNATGMHYQLLNDAIHQAIGEGWTHLRLKGVNGQRYIGCGLKGEGLLIDIEGLPGNDLATFMDGPTVRVYDNAQDGLCNTMNAGKVSIWGDAGDVLAYGMRGGKLFVRGDVGYRTGIHMKEYEGKRPLVVAGGRAGDFLGEYMAGGLLVVLGLDAEPGESLTGGYLGTGMHGGLIFLRGEVEDWQLGAEPGITCDLGDDDWALLREAVGEFASEFNLDVEELLDARFSKLWPKSTRPYGDLYAH
jgi:glutamate synthase domain-containing protein 3